MQERIRRAFTQATSYDEHGEVQSTSALTLQEKIASRRERLPSGPALELGCGTGLFSQYLVPLLTDRMVMLTDFAPAMVLRCQSRLDKAPNALFAVLDVEQLMLIERFSLVASNFVFHWQRDLRRTIRCARLALKPGGLLAFAVPIAGSFPEWREACRLAEVPFTANALPSSTLLNQLTRNGDTLEVRSIVGRYRTPLAFFRALRQMGAHQQLTPTPLTASQLLALNKTWRRGKDGCISVTYQVAHCFFWKDNSSERVDRATAQGSCGDGHRHRRW